MSIKKNVLYSGVLTTSLFLFQFITYPYVARVLGVSHMGVCNFVQSIVQYFVLFATWGTMALGVREIAKCNGDKEKLNRVFSSITSMNILMTAIVLIIYLIAVLLVPALRGYRILLYIGALQLISSVFTIEWLFRGLEEFKFITIRNILVRLCYVIAVFIFVQEPSDYIVYFSLTVGLYVLTAVVNLCHGGKFIRFYWVKIRTCFPLYIKPMLLLGGQNMLATMYTSFNIVYLGLVCGDTQIGYYTTATKIQSIVLALFSAFTMVLMPRISQLIENQAMDKVHELIRTSLAVLFAFSLPIMFYVMFYASQVVDLIAGAGYEEAVPLLRLTIPLILIVGLEQVFIVQLLIPMRKDRETSICYFVGAVVGIAMNIVLVSYLQSMGSVLVWFTSEFAVMLLSLYFVHRHIPLWGTLLRQMGKFFGAFAPLALLLYGLKQEIVVGSVVVVVYTHMILFYVVKLGPYQAVVLRVVGKSLRF